MRRLLTIICYAALHLLLFVRRLLSGCLCYFDAGDILRSHRFFSCSDSFQRMENDDKAVDRILYKTEERKYGECVYYDELR